MSSRSTLTAYLPSFRYYERRFLVQTIRSPLRHVLSSETKYGRSNMVQLCVSFDSEEGADGNVPVVNHYVDGVVVDFSLEAKSMGKHIVRRLEKIKMLTRETHRHPLPTGPSSTGHKVQDLLLGCVKRILTITKVGITRVFQLFIHIFQAVVFTIDKIRMNFPVLTFEIFCHCKKKVQESGTKAAKVEII